MMFDGKVGGTRSVNLGGRKGKADQRNVKDFVEDARKQREARARERLRNTSATKMQKVVRSKLSRNRSHQHFRALFDSALALSSSADVLGLAQLLFAFFRGADAERLVALLRLIDLSPSGVLAHLERPLSNSTALYKVARLGRLAADCVLEASAQCRSLLDFLASLGALGRTDIAMGATLSLLRCEHSCVCLRRMQLRQAGRVGMPGTAIAAVTAGTAGVGEALAELWGLLSGAVQEALGAVDALRQVGQAEQALLLGPLRGKAAVHVAKHLLTLPSPSTSPGQGSGPSPSASGGGFSVTSLQDWTAIFRHCFPSDRGGGEFSPLELLSLLANFCATFLTADSAQRVPLIDSGGGGGDSGLGPLFVRLAARLLDRHAEAGAKASLPLYLLAHLWVCGTPAISLSTGPEEQQQDYHTASGWRKLEFGLVGAQMRLLRAELDGQGAEADEGAGAEAEAAAASLAALFGMLCSKPVLGNLLLSIGSDITEPVGAEMEAGVVTDVALASGAEDMDVSAGGPVSPAPSRSRSADIILLYTQLLLSFPSEISTAGGGTGVGGSGGGIGGNGAFSSASKFSLLNGIAFAEGTEGRGSGDTVVRALWRHITQEYGDGGDAGGLMDLMTRCEDAALLRQMEAQPGAGEVDCLARYEALLSALYLFCTVLAQLLLAVDDEELLQQGRVLSLLQLRQLVVFLKKWLFKLYWLEPLFDINAGPEDVGAGAGIGAAVAAAAGAVYGAGTGAPVPLASTGFASGFSSTAFSTGSPWPPASPLSPPPSPSPTPGAYLHFLKLHCQCAATRLFTHLCDRNERRQYLSPEDWQWAPLSAIDLALDTPGSGVGVVGGVVAAEWGIVVKNGRAKAVLTYIPQVVPFKQRVSVLHAMLQRDQTDFYTSAGASRHAGVGTSTRISVRRDHLVEDAYRELGQLGAKLKGRVQVEFISGQGMSEAGIDGGGLFKEFLDSFAKAAFAPSFGLFAPTSHQLLTPDPSSSSAGVGAQHLQYFHFIGKILGKALYERMLVESEFAPGFLNALLGHTNALDDLFHLDETMHRSLMQLKHHANAGGDIESLELYFESSRECNGKVVTQEIVPGGSDLKVSRSNVHAYIHTLAHHKQNVEARDQCRALLAGFRMLVPLEWIRMFSTRELQLLISGDRRKIDLADMMSNVHYGSGYHPSQPYVQTFWQVVADMSPEDQGNLLRFVTSCSRQPLLGFGQLNPTFCIQKIPAYASQYTGLEPPALGEAPRLPSAATCMNLLKLPLYDSAEILRDKLLYAIRSNSGFELS